MSKFIIIAAFAVGASLGLTAGIDTLKPRLSEEEIPCCSEMKYCGASLADEEEALVNVAAVMGFNYAYEGFPAC